MLAVLCPMLLAAMLLLRAFLPLPEPIRWLRAATAILVALSVAVSLILVMIGPWQHRLAGVGLGVAAFALLLELGRASCGARVGQSGWISVGARELKTKN